MSGVLATLGIGFNVNKCKPALQMAVTRLNININKKTNLMKNKKREVGTLLKEDKEEKARLRVEAIIREDLTIEAYEILVLLCELLVERMRLIESKDDCPNDLQEAVCTLCWAADQAEIEELEDIRNQFRKKYGAPFVRNAVDNVNDCVNERVMQKLSVHPPKAFVVEGYLREIAKTYDVDWEPPQELTLEELTMEDAPVPTGRSVSQNRHYAELEALQATQEAGAPPARPGYGPAAPPRTTTPKRNDGPNVPRFVFVDTGEVEEKATEADASPTAPPDVPEEPESKQEESKDDDDGDDGAAAGGGASRAATGSSSTSMDYDSLAARFAALKR